MSKFLRSGGLLDVNDLVIPEDTVEIDIQNVSIADIKLFDMLIDKICKCRPIILKMINIEINNYLSLEYYAQYYHAIVKIINIGSLRALYVNNSAVIESMPMIDAISNSRIRTMYLSWHVKNTDFMTLQNNRYITTFEYITDDARLFSGYIDYTDSFREVVINNRIRRMGVVQKCAIIIGSKLLYRDLRILLAKYVLWLD